MENDKDERKRPNLRLVVNNPDKRKGRPAPQETEFIPLDELIARREQLRGEFYRGIDPWPMRGYSRLERFLAKRDWPYGFDPHHGRLLVLPAETLCPDLAGAGSTPHDEVLIYLMDDLAGKGLCLTLEMIIPFWSDDDAVMEDALLYSPVLQYGTLFLEENPQDNLLDLIYRAGFPLYPPLPTERLLDRIMAATSMEIAETLRALAQYEEQ